MYTDDFILSLDYEVNTSLIKNGNNSFKTRLVAAIDYKKSLDPKFNDARLADECGIDRSKIHAYRYGKTKMPHSKNLKKIADVLGVRTEYLTCESGFMTEEDLKSELRDMGRTIYREDINFHKENMFETRMYVWQIVIGMLRAYLSEQGLKDEELNDAVHDYDFSQYDDAVYDIVCYIRDRIRRQTFDNKRPERKDFWKYNYSNHI